MTDTGLVIDGAVTQVWRDTLPESIPQPGEGQVVAFTAEEAVCCGMLWDGSALSLPEPAPAALPDEVPMWKLRRFLIINAMMDAATAFLAGIPGIDGDLARSDFNSAPNFVVAGPFAAAFKAAQNLTDEQWRGMILAADAITA